MYFNRLKHSKIVISDFQLAKLENGLIKDPCGTPEYLGRGVSVGEFACLSIKIQISEWIMCFYSQLLRLLGGSDMGDPWTAGP